MARTGPRRCSVPVPHPLNIFAWIVSIAAGLGVVLGGIFLMPAITSLVASVFVDDVADHVELEHYPAEAAPASHCRSAFAMREGIKTALPHDPGLSDCPAFVFVAGAGFPRVLHRDGVAIGTGIFRACSDAVPVARGGQGDAQGQCRDHLHCRADHRGLLSRIPIVNLARRCSAWRSWSICTSACLARGRS